MAHSESMSGLSPHISIVLVQTKISGNIGAVARAMMNNGFNSLCLVNPMASHLNRECLDRAMSAEKIVRNALVSLDLKEAISNSHWVVGTSGKKRDVKIPVITPRKFAEGINQHCGKKISLVFGREDSGLSHEDLLLCDQLIEIPASPEFPSINLSHAVMIILYELYFQLSADPIPSTPGKRYEEGPATVEQKEAMYHHLKEALLAIHYLEADNPDKILAKLRALFSRAQLTEYETGLLRGLYSQILYFCQTKATP